MYKKLLLGLIHSKAGISGLALVSFLLFLSIYAFIFVPFDSYVQWNNPNYWINYPKSAAPAWSDFASASKSFVHTILTKSDAIITSDTIEGIKTITFTYSMNIQYDTFPSDFILNYDIKYGDVPPVIQFDVHRPDNKSFNLLYSSIPPSTNDVNYFKGRIFSTDKNIHDNLLQYQNEFNYNINNQASQIIIFSDLNKPQILKGNYEFIETFLLFDNATEIENTDLILGGKVFGLLGTDDLRRDLIIGIMWGSPVALFIGLTVSTFSIVIGLIYGVTAGYKGKRTDESLMRINDIFYSLPSLPLLIILSITFGRSIFLIAGFLIIFGWVGTAKVIRSIALQIKNFQYVDAAKLMGQSDLKIIFKHVIPQLLPITFASIAISVPAAIIGEAALSFLGLGDPSLPTWGQILHDANSSDAASRGIWWWIIPPGFMISLTGIAFFLIGTTLDKITNPLKQK